MKYIKWFEWEYSITEEWNVWSHKTNQWLKSIHNWNWYFLFALWKNGWYKRIYIHRLVAETFLVNLENKPQVNHKNGIKSDNSIENLEWVTVSENHKHKYRVLWWKIPLHQKDAILKANCRKIWQYSSEWHLIKIFVSASDVKRKLWFDNSSIHKCAKWKVTNSYWYVWKYL